MKWRNYVIILFRESWCPVDLYETEMMLEEENEIWCAMGCLG
jgi:hypothetical protein